MDQELGSILAYCYKRRAIKVYLDKIPEGMEFPSMYFPPPLTSSKPFTSAAYERSASLSLKVFAAVGPEAHGVAEDMAYGIRNGKFRIPLVDAVGTATGRYLHFTDVQVKMLDDDIAGVAELTLRWDTRHNFVSEVTWPKMQHIYTNLIIRIGG